MERRKRTSMYDPYREDIVTALEAGKTIRQIYDEIGLIPCGFARKRNGRCWRWLKRRRGGARYDREGER